MSDAVEPLILDLLEWVVGGERGYGEMMEAWRTSCPKLPVWEEANARGLVTRISRTARRSSPSRPAGEPCSNAPSAATR